MNTTTAEIGFSPEVSFKKTTTPFWQDASGNPPKGCSRDIAKATGRRTTYIAYEIARLSAILDRTTVSVPALQNQGRRRETERPFVSFSASDFEVEALLSARAKALGNGLFRWISGLMIPKEEASKLLEHAVLDALSSLASTLRSECESSSDVEINPVLRGRLQGGIATRLGRVDRKMGDEIAEQLIERLERLLVNKRLRVDGRSDYLLAGKPFIKLEKLVSVREIYENVDGKWGPASDVSL